MLTVEEPVIQTIKAEVVNHKGEQRVKLVFDYSNELIQEVRKIPGCRWSKTMRRWHVPYNQKSMESLREFVFTEWQNKPELKKNTNKFYKEDKIPTISNEPEIKNFIWWLKGQRYSEKTVATYTDAIQVFLRFYENKAIDEIDNNDIVKFNYDYIIKNGYSSTYQNQVISALKLFFSRMKKKDLILNEIERPMHGHRLPEILSLQEVAAIIKHTINLKHKTILSLIYACGLRRSELLNLTLNSIDSKRGLLIIKYAKGNKDRVVPIPVSLIEKLRTYYVQFKPKKWLFESKIKGEQYSDASLWKIYKEAKERAGIKKHVTLHSLRHSYATHLLENGTDLRYIQELLGHKSSRTTEIYTHVSNKAIQRIRSPFESLDL